MAEDLPPPSNETWILASSPDAFPARSLRILLDKVAIHCLLLSGVLYASRVYRLIDSPLAQPLALGTYCGIALAYTAVALLERRFAHVLIQVLYLFLIVLETYQFAHLASVPIVPNAVFQYLLPTAFVAFAVVIEDGLGQYAVRMLLRYSLGYTVFYTLIGFLFNARLVPAESLSALVLDDPERGERLYNLLALTAFAWFFCLADLRRRPRIMGLAGLIVCGGAIALTLSRVYIVCVVLITATWLAGFRSASIRLMCLGILWTVSLSMLAGLIDATWNPFQLFAGDSSGSARLDEYDMTLQILRHSPVFGAGIPPSEVEVGDMTGNPYFAAGDLGALGVWFDLGLVGLVAFFAGSHIVCTVRQELEDRFVQPVFLTGCLLVAYGCIAQTVLYPPAGMFFAIVLAFWLRARRSYDGPPSPPDRAPMA